MTYRLRQLTQDSAKFMHHGKRARLLCDDVDQVRIGNRSVEQEYCSVRFTYLFVTFDSFTLSRP